MRLAWTFIAGMVLTGFVLLTTLPLGLAVGGLAALFAKPVELFTALSGESLFGVRQIDGRVEGRLVNVNFRTMMVPVAGDPRPRRLLMRLEVLDSDIFAQGVAAGRVRLDAWSLEDAQGLRGPALYTVVAPGRSASIEEDGTLVVENGPRRSVYSLASGAWLYDFDSPVAAFALEGDRRRVLALAAAEDGMPVNAIAVLTYANNQTALKRLLVTAADPARARLLRSSVALTRPVARLEDARNRTIDLPLAAGALRIPLHGDELDLKAAQVPAGLAVVELESWTAR